MLTAELNDYCRAAGIEEGTVKREPAGFLILPLFRRATTPPEALAAAMKKKKTLPQNDR